MTETGCRQSAHFHHLVVEGKPLVVGGNKYSEERIFGHCISGLTSLVDSIYTPPVENFDVPLNDGVNLI